MGFLETIVIIFKYFVDHVLLIILAAFFSYFFGIMSRNKEREKSTIQSIAIDVENSFFNIIDISFGLTEKFGLVTGSQKEISMSLLNEFALLKNSLYRELTKLESISLRLSLNKKFTKPNESLNAIMAETRLLWELLNDFTTKSRLEFQLGNYDRKKMLGDSIRLNVLLSKHQYKKTNYINFMTLIGNPKAKIKK